MIRFPPSPRDHREKRGCPALAEQPLWLRHVRNGSLETLTVALTLTLLAQQLLQVLAQLFVGNTAVAGVGRAVILLLVLQLLVRASSTVTFFSSLPRISVISTFSPTSWLRSAMISRRRS